MVNFYSIVTPTAINSHSKWTIRNPVQPFQQYFIFSEGQIVQTFKNDSIFNTQLIPFSSPGFQQSRNLTHTLINSRLS